MKKIKTYFAALMISAVLFSATPVAAQTVDNQNSTTTRTTDDNRDSGKWGLLGLLGLVGLYGLKKKDDGNYSTTDKSVRNRM